MDSLLQGIKQRWALYLPFALLVVLAVGYSVYWIVLSRDVEDRIERWAELQRAQGLTVQYDNLTISGYPYRFDIYLGNVVLGDPSHVNAWSWSIEQATAVTLPYRLNQVLVEITGAQQFSYQEALTTEARAPRRFHVDGGAGRWRASLILLGQKLDRLSFEMEALEAVRTGGGDAPLTVTADHIQFHAQLRSETGDGSRLYLSSQNMSLPTLQGLEDMQGPVEIVELDFETDQPIERLLSRKNLQSWIEGGGTVDIAKLRVLWDGVDVTGDGALEFDKQSRPAGTMNTLIGGHDRLVDRLVARQAIGQNEAGLVRSALALLAIAGGDPQGRVRTQLKIEDGEISVGPAKLGRVGSVRVD